MLRLTGCGSHWVGGGAGNRGGRGGGLQTGGYRIARGEATWATLVGDVVKGYVAQVAAANHTFKHKLPQTTDEDSVKTKQTQQHILWRGQ